MSPESSSLESNHRRSFDMISLLSERDMFFLGERLLRRRVDFFFAFGYSGAHYIFQRRSHLYFFSKRTILLNEGEKLM